MKPARFAFIAVLSLALSATPAAFAAPAAFESGPTRAESAGSWQMAQNFVPLERVLASLRRQYSGHHLSVSGPSRSGGGYVYRIKWLTEGGAVLYVVADAESGAILSVEGS